MAKKEWVVFEVHGSFPVMSKRPLSFKEADEVWKKSKIDIDIEELGVSMDFYLLGKRYSTEDKETAKQILRDLREEWLKENQGLYTQDFVEMLLGETE